MIGEILFLQIIQEIRWGNVVISYPWFEGFDQGSNISLAEHRHHDKDWQKLPKNAKNEEVLRGGGLLVQQTQMETEELGRGSASYHRPAQIFERHQAPLSAQYCLKPGLEKGQKIHKTQNIPCS